MSYKPIIFSGPMVRALLDGRKTMTRRLAWHLGKRAAFDDDPWTDARETLWQEVRPGDRLWVRENWKPNSIYSVLKPSEMPIGVKVFYQANNVYAPSNTPWVPSIHMPRWASRLTLTVTATKIERLQDISEADAKAEGAGLYVPGHGWITEAELQADPGYSNYLSPRMGFVDIWTTLHGPDAWHANPELVVIAFTVSKANIDREAA